MIKTTTINIASNKKKLLIVSTNQHKQKNLEAREDKSKFKKTKNTMIS